MKIGGMQKVSLIDFPGRVAAVLFTAGCNFACPYCHNPELVNPKPDGLLDTEAVFRFLEKRRGMLDGVVITGGEPTLQPDLAESILAIREMGFAVKLDTNGSRPEVLSGLFEKKLVDYVAMDAKTAPRLYPSYLKAACKPRDIEKSMELIMGSGVGYEFRTTCARPMVDPEVVKELCGCVAGAATWIFQPCGGDRTLVPGFGTRNGMSSRDDLSELAHLCSPFVKRAEIRA
ncbi:MAG: anaerobic ribonucleoside-triphosphate reductase activating protein [Thermodesulfobacteriota bacterium]